MNAENELLIEHRDGVLWLTINRPDAGNAIPYTVRDALTEQFFAAHRDLNVRCVVLTAAGERHFCTGADLRVRPPAPALPEGAPARPVGSATQTMRDGFQRLMTSMMDCEKPIIAALNGTAAGGGMMLALASDLVIAAENAKLVQVFVRRGLVPDGGVAYLLPRVVGMHKAKELLFFGDDLTAAEGLSLGLINKVVPPAELVETAQAWASRLADGPTKAIGWTKRLLHDATGADRDRLLLQEALLVELNTATADSQEGVSSFVERRDPVWRGF
ncbi:MAG: enoyl-CoA hydratase-related protein [Acidimicrobiia bacterium]